MYITYVHVKAERKKKKEERAFELLLLRSIRQEKKKNNKPEQETRWPYRYYYGSQRRCSTKLNLGIDHKTIISMESVGFHRLSLKITARLWCYIHRKDGGPSCN